MHPVLGGLGMGRVAVKTHRAGRQSPDSRLRMQTLRVRKGSPANSFAMKWTMWTASVAGSAVITGSGFRVQGP